MSISIFNKEHYRDPTAYSALMALTRKELEQPRTRQPQHSIPENIKGLGGYQMNRYSTEQMNSNVIAPNQRIKLIALDECVPTDYQRATSIQQVEKIISEFDESRLGVLTVSLRDGLYRIVDGLHRSLGTGDK